MNNKVVIIGCGNVGMSYAYALLNQRTYVNKLVLIDLNKERTIGEVMDLNHCLPYAPSKISINVGDYSDCKDARLVVIAAGANQKPGETRLDLIDKNAQIFKDIVDNVMSSGFNGIFLVATNPLDVMTYLTYKYSGLPAHRVIGSGTSLDTARLRYMLADYFKVSSKNVHAYIMGEHGDSSFVPWKHTYVGCKKIIDIMKDNNHPIEDLEKIHKNVVNAAYEIIEKKKATYYGIGMSLNRLVRAILDDENSVLTVSTYLEDGKYGQNDVYIGVPAIINENGVRELLELDLDNEEYEKLNNSCNVIKKMREDSIEKIIEE